MRFIKSKKVMAPAEFVGTFDGEVREVHKMSDLPKTPMLQRESLQELIDAHVRRTGKPPSVVYKFIRVYMNPTYFASMDRGSKQPEAGNDSSS